uniref:Uncharacterized protein n=1 Tax=Dimocarpus longan TaxID=128017 RepID=B7U3Y4_9ROSI|nr:unknown [Dimocarpus longan]
MYSSFNLSSGATQVLENIAAIAPAHKCLVVFMAPRPRTLTLVFFFTVASITTLSASILVSSGGVLSSICSRHTFPSFLKLTDKNKPPVCTRFEEEETEQEMLIEDAFDEIKRIKEEETVGSRNKPPLTKNLELEVELRRNGELYYSWESGFWSKPGIVGGRIWFSFTVGQAGCQPSSKLDREGIRESSKACERSSIWRITCSGALCCWRI